MAPLELHVATATAQKVMSHFPSQVNDCEKFLFKVKEHITLECCYCTKHKLIAASQFLGLGMNY